MMSSETSACLAHQHDHASDWVIDETRYAPFEVMRTHYHPGPTLSLVFRGGYIERFGGASIAGEPLTAILKPALFAHENYMSPLGLHALYVEPSMVVMETICPELALPTAPIALGSAKVRALVGLVLHEVRERDGLSDLCLHAYLLEILGEAARQQRMNSTGRVVWLGHVRDRLREEFRATPRIEALAGDVGVHPVHLAQAFRQRYGCTVGEYIRHLRVEHAAAQLRGSNSISRIALEAGFADHSHLTRVFRRIVGMTPSKYRELVA
jgi:AraC-like DNA-binding protein